MKSLLTLAAIAVLAVPVLAQVESLPPVVVNRNSFEILSNSRYSSHSGFTSSVPTQVLANILWAMNRAPSLGSAYREFYVATASNVYTYDTSAHVLRVHLAGNHRYISNSAFEVGVAVERYEEAGLCVQAGLLASVAFWDSAGGSVSSCPMTYAANYANSNWNPAHTILMVNVHGQRAMTGLTDSCVARSSDSSLPLPTTDGANSYEELLGALEFDTLFDPAVPPAGARGQLLWAGYGVAPHMTTNGRRGTTIPSAIANYYLTRRIYLVGDTALWRYHNRVPPGTGLATSDHRLESVSQGDRRAALRTAAPRLPGTAPLYIVVTVADTGSAYGPIEAGFAAFQFLVQARALGLGGHILAPLETAERAAIQSSLGLPAADWPAVVFSTGPVFTGVTEPRGRVEPRPAGGVPGGGAQGELVFDALGCRAAGSRLAPGVYFVRQAGPGSQGSPGVSRKVVVAR
ncbi:MAG: nitroreductase family protein [bacterium]